jgi:cell filamentation protein
MLAVLMASQAGLPPLNFNRIRGRALDAYFAAVRAGLSNNYQPMVRIFELVMAGTTRRAGKKSP